MLNYANLSDFDFENLCKDVLSEILGVQLRSFTKGKDGGIDLTDNVEKPEIVVQVKHSMKTHGSTLRDQLRKEVPKLSKINPKQYYIATSCSLTPDMTEQIFQLFSNYMKTSKNIYTLIEIDSFLNNPQNRNILQKHLKLYLESVGILDRIYNNDIFVDCEVLMDGIENVAKQFVETESYNRVIDTLERNKVAFILGNPGTGKTMTSKMAVLKYASDGYTVRYADDSTDLRALKKSLSANRKVKEIIFVDDCLGQAYFKMKEFQSKEITDLIKYVYGSANKKLIMNSRITIFMDAKLTSQYLDEFTNEDRFTKCEVVMNDISLFDKARILYAHLYFGSIDNEYVLNLCENENYWKIIKHKNYNPRIIEYITNKKRIDVFTSPGDYLQLIMNKLDNPEEIWRDEYINKLQEVDRILLNTLFSLTDKTVDKEVLRCAYNTRLKNNVNVDVTVNQFEQSLKRLSEGFVSQIYTKRGTVLVSAFNPSVNDFLKNYLDDNSLEKQRIIESAISFEQLYRMMNTDDFKMITGEKVRNGDVVNYQFSNESTKAAFIVYYSSMLAVTKTIYKTYFDYFLKFPDDCRVADVTLHTIGDVYRMMFTSSNIEFYELKSFFSSEEIIDETLDMLTGRDLHEAIDAIYKCFTNNDSEQRALFYDCAASHIQTEIENEIQNASLQDYSIDFDGIIENASDFEGNVDIQLAAQELKDEFFSCIEYHLTRTLAGSVFSATDIRDVINSYDLPDINYDEEIKNYLESRSEDKYIGSDHDDYEIITLFDSLKLNIENRNTL